MLYVFRVVSPALSCGTPASDLDGEEWTFQDVALERATLRAERRLDQTFAYASERRVAASSVHYVTEYTSLQAYHRAQEAA
jgi:hypothetical protein